MQLGDNVARGQLGAEPQSPDCPRGSPGSGRSGSSTCWARGAQPPGEAALDPDGSGAAGCWPNTSLPAGSPLEGSASLTTRPSGGPVLPCGCGREGLPVQAEKQHQVKPREGRPHFWCHGQAQSCPERRCAHTGGSQALGCVGRRGGPGGRGCPLGWLGVCSGATGPLQRAGRKGSLWPLGGAFVAGSGKGGFLGLGPSPAVDAKRQRAERGRGSGGQEVRRCPGRRPSSGSPFAGVRGASAVGWHLE